MNSRLGILSCLLLLCLPACSTYAPQPLKPCTVDCKTEIQVKSEHEVTVSTTILTDDQAAQLYGVDLASVGLQAIWLRLDNQSDHAHWLLVAALDENYYAPNEAAALFSLKLSAKDEERASQRFHGLAIPLKSPAGEVTEGYVLAPRQEGGRYIPVMLTGDQHLVNFGFAVSLPDGEFDFEELEPEKIYPERERPNLSLAQLRARLRDLPCCAVDKKGEREGDPLNLALVGGLDDVLAALSRGGWSFTHRINLGTIKRLVGAAISGAAYPVAPISPLYLFDRQQDLGMQRARNTILQRNHLRLWLAPFEYENQPVWVGQISRDISIKSTFLSPTLTTHVIDPNIDEAREHLLQSLLVAGVVETYGFDYATQAATPDAPRENLTEDRYYTDGLRLLMQLTGSDTIPPEDVVFIEWKKSSDPIDVAKAASEEVPEPGAASPE